jgi:rhomboid protease GluP
MDQRRMCPHCRAFITTKDRVCPYCNERVGPKAVETRPSDTLAGFIPHARFTTVLIMLINFGFYLATTIYSVRSGAGNVMDIDTDTLYAFGAKYGPSIQAGEWWRLITAGFLHADIMHIMMNSWALFDLGAAVEEAYGTSRLLTIYIFSTITGFYASAVWSPLAPSVGASAAIFGLLGAMLALGLRDRSHTGDAMRGMYIRWAVFMLIISLFGRIDMAAHVGGLVGGFLMAFLAGQPRLTLTFMEKTWRVSAWFFVGVTISAFMSWYRWYVQGGA